MRDGKVGSLINLVGAAEVAAVQRVAVEETRLKIPLFFGYDVIHGHRTLFPVPIAEAGAFDPDLWQRTARAAATEAAADGQDVTFSPMVDVSRDPRWGRTVEGAGEDPWLNARFGEAKTRGYQGPGLTATDALAGCVKHFVGYGGVLAGREYAPSDISPREVREVYLPPFEAAVRAGVAAIMPSLNSLDGVPMTAHRELLEGFLRGRLGFDGLVISDYGAVRELVNHGTAADEAEAAALCIKAGCDVDMMGYAYVDHLPEAVARGLCTEAEVDVCVRRVLRFKERLGLFADPFRRCRLGEPPVARTLAREAAARSIVLLKNEGDLLPLAGGRRRIAAIGPLADAPARDGRLVGGQGQPVRLRRRAGRAARRLSRGRGLLRDRRRHRLRGHRWHRCRRGSGAPGRRRGALRRRGRGAQRRGHQPHRSRPAGPPARASPRRCWRRARPAWRSCSVAGRRSCRGWPMARRR